MWFAEAEQVSVSLANPTEFYSFVGYSITPTDYASRHLCPIPLLTRRSIIMGSREYKVVGCVTEISYDFFSNATFTVH